MDVTTLFKHVGSDAKGKFEAPTEGSNEWNQWLSFSNQELDKWAELHDWTELRNPGYVVQAETSGTSVAIPGRFKKMAGSFIINNTFFKEVDSDQFDKYTSSDNVFRVEYDSTNAGWYVEWKGALTSGASAIIPFYHYHTALASPNNTINMRNPMYLAKRLTWRILRYRQDPIFTEIEAEADLMLAQMLENEYYKHSQYEAGITTREEETGFILGLD